MTERFVVVPAVYVYFLRDAQDGGREVLLQLREGTGFMDGHWAAACAGHVEKGESVYAAAAREAVEEVDVRDIEPELLWSQVGLVPQKPYLFSGTVASNLRYGRPEAAEGAAARLRGHVRRLKRDIRHNLDLSDRASGAVRLREALSRRHDLV